jgi:two-component system, cell cycle sensor histidine kinase and response regulator CckA
MFSAKSAEAELCQSTRSGWIAGELNDGTVCKLYRSVIGTESEVSSVRSMSEAKMIRGTGTILLVEDEESLARVESEVLEDSGFKVLVANDSTEALRISNDFSAPIDLLVTDVVLPGIGGKELADQLRSHRVGLKVLFMSGYASESLEDKVSDCEDFLHKPFKLSTLVRAVQDALNR